MAHMAQIQYAYNKGGGEYDFSDQFTYLKDFVKDSDISIGNYETTTNPDLPVAGFPRFNVPAAHLKDLKENWFGHSFTANNHLWTQSLKEFSTMEAAKEAGLDYVGSFKDKSDRILFASKGGQTWHFWPILTVVMVGKI